jgi:hypothetical protein
MSDYPPSSPANGLDPSAGSPASPTPHEPRLSPMPPTSIHILCTTQLPSHYLTSSPYFEMAEEIISRSLPTPQLSSQDLLGQVKLQSFHSTLRRALTSPLILTISLISNDMRNPTLLINLEYLNSLSLHKYLKALKASTWILL